MQVWVEGALTPLPVQGQEWVSLADTVWTDMHPPGVVHLKKGPRKYPGMAQAAHSVTHSISLVSFAFGPAFLHLKTSIA